MKRVLLFVAVILVADAFAAKPKKNFVGRRTPARAMVRCAADETPWRRTPYVGAISADAATGNVLFSAFADRVARPASVTKLMTLLLVLEDVKAALYTPDDIVTVTPDVNRSQASWIGLRAGDRMTVRDLCLALMVESANDAAIALGVHSVQASNQGGDGASPLDDFVRKMNARARALGMNSTEYFNPNGLPAPKFAKSYNVTTARDQLKLALALLALPEVFSYTNVKTADLVKTSTGYRVNVTRRAGKGEVLATELADGEKIVKTLVNHNNVMVKDRKKIINPDGGEAVDGLKTGYIDAGGSSIVITGSRNGRRAVAVVLGSASADLRDEHAAKILRDALGALAW